MRRLAPLFAAVIVVGLALPAPAAPRGGGVHLVKIAFDPPGADNGSNASLNKETVTIANTGNTPVNMTGWTLRDRDQHVYRFPTFTLRPGHRVTIHNGQGSDNAGHLYWDSDGYVWNNDGDTAKLRSPNGSQGEACHYTGTGSTATC